MPHISVWIHFVWTTKDREPILSESIRYKVFEHIRENAKAKNIFIGALNGWVEHVHCLVSLGSGQILDDVMRLLKGESSHWINKSQLCHGKFHWQDEYFAVSVSESLLPKVRNILIRRKSIIGPNLLTMSSKTFLSAGDLSEEWAKAQEFFVIDCH